MKFYTSRYFIRIGNEKMVHFWGDIYEFCVDLLVKSFKTHENCKVLLGNCNS